MAPPQFDPPQTAGAATWEPILYMGCAGAAPAVEAGGEGADEAGCRGPRPISDIQQIGKQGGLTALHYVARDGFMDAAMMLLDSGVRESPSAGDRSPSLIATVNGNFDLAMRSSSVAPIRTS